MNEYAKKFEERLNNMTHEELQARSVSYEEAQSAGYDPRNLTEEEIENMYTEAEIAMELDEKGV